MPAIGLIFSLWSNLILRLIDGDWYRSAFRRVSLWRNSVFRIRGGGWYSFALRSVSLWRDFVFRIRGGGWYRSSFCNNGACLEARSTNRGVEIRDSKDQRGPALHFSSRAWNDFLEGVAAGEFVFHPRE